MTVLPFASPWCENTFSFRRQVGKNTFTNICGETFQVTVAAWLGLGNMRIWNTEDLQCEIHHSTLTSTLRRTFLLYILHLSFAPVIIAPCWYSTFIHVYFSRLGEAKCNPDTLSSGWSAGLLCFGMRLGCEPTMHNAWCFTFVHFLVPPCLYFFQTPCWLINTFF